LEHVFRLAIDPLFPIPESAKRRELSDWEIMAESMPENKAELIFHEAIDGRELLNQVSGDISCLLEEDPSLLEISDEEVDEEQESDEEEL
jgi:hypothetical protein